MTGAGTQADPYIVDNYPDFVEAAGTAGAYVEFVANTKIDMNDVSPSGVGQLTINCANIDGKNSEITNIYCTADIFLHYNHSGQSCVVSHLKLTNIKMERTLIYVNAGSMTFKECVFSGISYGTASSYTVVYTNTSSNSSASLSFTTDELGCSLTIDAPNGAAFCNGYYNKCPSFYNCNLKINCNILVYSSNCAVYLENSFLSGNIKYANSIRAKYSVINTISDSVTDYSSSYIRNTIVNSDTATSVSQYFSSVTTAQMHNAEYLQSIGFPIGV